MHCTKTYLLLLILLSYNCVKNLQAQVTKKIILEEFTGSWCGFCPDGFVTYDLLANEYENIIGVSVHISDPMSIPASIILSDTYSGGGVNVFLLDRYLFQDIGFVQFSYQYEPLAEKIPERLVMESPVAVSIQNVDYNIATRELKASVRANFFAEVNVTDLRLNLWLVEDKVANLADGYDQVNFFHGLDGHVYGQSGNPIKGFTHQNVLRSMLGGVWGTEGSIGKGNIKLGESFIYTYQTILDENWDASQLQLIALVQNYSSGQAGKEILNAENVHLKTVADVGTITNITELKNNFYALHLYPNPSTGAVQIEFYLPKNTSVQAHIFDIFGKNIQMLRSNELMNAGAHSLLWNGKNESGTSVPVGIYFVAIRTSEGEQVQRITIF